MTKIIFLSIVIYALVTIVLGYEATPKILIDALLTIIFLSIIIDELGIDLKNRKKLQKMKNRHNYNHFSILSEKVANHLRVYFHHKFKREFSADNLSLNKFQLRKKLNEDYETLPTCIILVSNITPNTVDRYKNEIIEDIIKAKITYIIEGLNPCD